MTEPKVTKLYICDICGAERNGDPHMMHVDAPYLPHIHKRKLCKVCNVCVKQVQEFFPKEEKNDESWFK